MKTIYLTIISAFLFLSFTLSAKTINVPVDSPTIQSAINESTDGDTVLVAPGEYFENINFKGKNIVVASHLVLDGDRSFIESTIINGSNPANNDSASCVLFISGETRNAVLEGFTITGGSGTLWRDEHGAGDYIEGGGILSALSSPTIRNNIIDGNSVLRYNRDAASTGGGGIRAGDGNPLIENNIIRNNSGMYGGGIVMNYSLGIIRNNIIIENEVKALRLRSETFGGGGIWCNTCDTVYVINNTIVGNSSSGSGTYDVAGKGGGALIWGSRVIFKNNIVWGNSQTEAGGLHESSLLGGSKIFYNNIEEGHTGTGNISAEPMFEGDSYLLSDDSPSIDAGDPDDMYLDLPDDNNNELPKWPSKGTRTNDQGAYGGPNALSMSGSSTGISKEQDGRPAETFNILHNYPNPFNPSTTFEFGLAKQAEVSLVVYDTNGRRIAKVINQSMSKGIHRTAFNPGNISSGIYEAVLSVDGRVESLSKIAFVK